MRYVWWCGLRDKGEGGEARRRGGVIYSDLSLIAGIGQQEGKSKGNAPGWGGGRKRQTIDLSDESMYLYVGYNRRERMLPSPRLAFQKQNEQRISKCVAEHAAADAKDGKMMPNRRVDDGMDSRSTAWCTGERFYACSATAPEGE